MSSDDQKPTRKAKVELDEADDGISLGALLLERKKKLSNVGSKSLSKPKKEELRGEDGVGKSPKMDSGSASKGTKVKKQEQFSSIDDDFDEKPAKKSPAAKRDMELKKKKKVKEEEEKSKSSKGKPETQKKGKKVYDLPGQKRDPPEERDPLRIFYETLYKQVPHSEMAQFWMMESGLLSKEEAKKVFEKKQKKTLLQKLSSPVKAVSAVKSITKTAIVKKTVQSSPVSSNKKTTTTVNSKVVAKQTKKRKSKDESSEDESDDDFVISRSLKKKPRAA